MRPLIVLTVFCFCIAYLAGVEFTPELESQGLAGDPEAQYQMGSCYLYGSGVERDSLQAVKWLKLSAEQGLAEAQYTLGSMLMEGKGIPQDLKEAAKWFQLAEKQGYYNALYMLAASVANVHLGGTATRENYADMLRMSDHGKGEVQRHIGMGYQNRALATISEIFDGYIMANALPEFNHADSLAVTREYEEAARWFRLGAEKGDAEAAYSLGDYYWEGVWGIPQDLDECVRFYKQAAERGHEEAQYSLGWCYLSGKGVDRDYAEAETWLLKAANQDNQDALYLLAQVYALQGRKPELLSALGKLVAEDTSYKEKAREENLFKPYWEDQEFLDLTRE